MDPDGRAHEVFLSAELFPPDPLSAPFHVPGGLIALVCACSGDVSVLQVRSEGPSVNPPCPRNAAGAAAGRELLFPPPQCKTSDTL